MHQSNNPNAGYNLTKEQVLLMHRLYSAGSLNKDRQKIEEEYMKNQIILLLSLLIILSCQEKKENIGELYRITFEEGFKGDTISLYINSQLIFKNRFVKTNLSYSATGTEFFVEKNEKSTNGYLYGKPFKIGQELISDDLFLELFLNEEKKTFNVDLSNGRFIGFNIYKEELELVQRAKPNFYD